MDGLHHDLMSIAVTVLDVSLLSFDAATSTMKYANDTARMGSSAHSLQHLINTHPAFCILMGFNNKHSNDTYMLIR